MNNREDESTVVKYKNIFQGLTQSTHTINISLLTRVFGGHANKF